MPNFTEFPISYASISTDGSRITGNGTAGNPLTIPDEGIDLAAIENIATLTMLGNNTGSTGPVLALTVAQVLAMLSIDDLITLSGVAGGSANLGSFTGTTIADNQTIKAALQALETALEAVSSSDVPQWKDVGNGTTLLCTSGVTSSDVTKSGGVVTITVPSGQRVTGIRVVTQLTDYVYTSGPRSDGFKIKIDNSANGETPGLSLEFLQYSTFGTVSALSPLLINSSVNLSTKGSDEMDDAGIFSMMFWDLGGITEGGIIQG